jgi:hypothetical protein
MVNATTLDGFSSRHDKSGKKYGEKNTKMLDPILRTDWKDVRQSPCEILSTEQHENIGLRRCPEKEVLLRTTNIKKY